MTAARVQDLLDICVNDVDALLLGGGSLTSRIKPDLRDRIDSWNFGGYGWTSPVNLLMTAAWVKWISPDQDVCKIWSRDSQGEKIPGGYSIRSMDEKFTIPLVAKFQLYEQFCSPNSGMQGTRALEKNKLRNTHSRIDRDSDLGQKVRFDIVLFQNIINDINELGPTEARDIFCYFIEKSLLIKSRILNEKESLGKSKTDDLFEIKNIIFSAVATFGDPQFVKAVGVAIFTAMLSLPRFEGCTVRGKSGSQTAADARAGTPGDIWIENADGDVVSACEIKDVSKTIGFDVLAALGSRVRGHGSLDHYFLVSAANEAVSYKVKSDVEWDRMIKSYARQGVVVLATSLENLFDVVGILAPFGREIIDSITETLVVTRDLKKDTVRKWRDILQ